MYWVYGFGFLGAAISIASYWMQGIIRLRLVAIFSNVASLVYGFLAPSPVTIFQHLVSLPLNIARLREMLRLVDNVRIAASGDLSMEWLKPIMRFRACAAGEMVFRRDEAAEELYIVARGEFRLVESGIVLAQGEMVGEIGLVSEGNRRTQSLECVAAGELLVATYVQIKELYYANPEFGFYFLKLVSRRLLQNNATLQAEIARRDALQIANPTAI